jgi:hypothetical protein
MRHFLTALAVLVGSSFATPASADFTDDIPWTVIESTVEALLREEIASKYSGREKCPTVLCPDAEWEVKIQTDFRLTRKSPPTIRPRGPSGWLDGVDVEFDLQGEVRLTVDPFVRIVGPARNIDPDDWTITKLIGIHAIFSAYTRPDVEKEPLSVQVWLTDDGGNISVDGLNRDLIILGAEVGAVGGAIFLGDPLTGAFLGVLAGDRAAEAAEKAIRKRIAAAATTAINVASAQLNHEVQTRVVPEGNRLIDALATLISTFQ